MFFREYGQNKCLFECLWIGASGRCGCVPWKYPQMSGGEDNVCDSMGNLCWDTIFNNGSYLTNCSCYNDCSQITYKYFTTQQELKASDCSKDCLVKKYLNTFLLLAY